MALYVSSFIRYSVHRISDYGIWNFDCICPTEYWPSIPPYKWLLKFDHSYTWLKLCSGIEEELAGVAWEGDKQKGGFSGELVKTFDRLIILSLFLVVLLALLIHLCISSLCVRWGRGVSGDNTCVWATPGRRDLVDQDCTRPVWLSYITRRCGRSRDWRRLRCLEIDHHVHSTVESSPTLVELKQLCHEMDRKLSGSNLTGKRRFLVGKQHRKSMS